MDYIIDFNKIDKIVKIVFFDKKEPEKFIKPENNTLTILQRVRNES